MKENCIKAAGLLLRLADFRLYYRFCSLMVRKMKGERVVSVSNFEINLKK
jgi:hypothetical protein